jgi:hypothetical protein
MLPFKCVTAFHQSVGYAAAWPSSFATRRRRSLLRKRGPRLGCGAAQAKLFEIGSNTKVFTTNLARPASLHRSAEPRSATFQLSGASRQSQAANEADHLKQLGDFTAGIADEASQCSTRPNPGCLPSGRPTIQFVVPRDWTMTPPPGASLPAPYNYSNFSAGLLGLLLAAPPAFPTE